MTKSLAQPRRDGPFPSVEWWKVRRTTMSLSLSSSREIDERLLEHDKFRVHRHSSLFFEDRGFPPWTLPEHRVPGTEQ